MAQGQQPYKDDLCKQMEKVKIQPMDQMDNYVYA